MRSEVPQSHGVVARSREQDPFVWGEGETRHVAAVALEGGLAHQTTVLQREEVDGAVSSRGNEEIVGLRWERRRVGTGEKSREVTAPSDTETRSISE